MEKMKFETPDMTERNIDKIAALFPNCVTEMKDEKGKIKRGVNFEMLKQMLSPDVVESGECYEFTWVGKKASIVEANKSIRKTLRPCKEESKDWDTTKNLYIEALAGELPQQGQDDLHRPAVQHRQRLHLRRRLHANAKRRGRADGAVRRGWEPPIQKYGHARTLSFKLV